MVCESLCDSRMQDPGVLRAHLLYLRAFLAALESDDWIISSNTSFAGDLDCQEINLERGGDSGTR
jgi:hypothetical protein